MTQILNEAAEVQRLNLWSVARIDERRLPDERRAELHTWLTGLGVPWLPRIPYVVLTYSAVDGRYRAHLSVQVDDAAGECYVDHAAGRVHTEPLVFPVTEFPRWLVAASQQQAADEEWKP